MIQKLKNKFQFFLIFILLSLNFWNLKIQPAQRRLSSIPFYILQQQHAQLQKNRLLDMQSKLQSIEICTNQALIATFLKIQCQMKFSEIIPLFQTSQFVYPFHNSYAIFVACESTHNRPDELSIITSKKMKTLSPTLQCSILIHELRHAKQYKYKIGTFSAATNQVLSKKIEYDAESFAAHCMKCFVCQCILKQTAFINPNDKGYFCKQDYEPYLQKALKNNQLCKAHRYFTMSDLKNLNTDIDFHCGPLKDRLPEHFPRMPFFSNQPN